MSDENNGKDESGSITSHTPRKRNIISGIDDSHLALGLAGVVGAGLVYVIAKPHIDNFIQNMALARQQNPPPPPPTTTPLPVTPQPELPLPATAAVNEYVDETEPSRELGEVDHKNYQTTRRKSNSSPFGASIARG